MRIHIGNLWRGRVLASLLLFAFLFLTPQTGIARGVFEKSNYFSFQVNTQNKEAFREVRDGADALLLNLGERMGALEEVRAKPTIAVTITSNREAFREAQSNLSAVDHWAAGTAYPAQSKIFLSLDAHDFFSKDDIALHEIAHIAVYRAAGKHRLPRWFEEGMAIYLAGEELVSRVETATAASIFSELPALATYTRRFPSATGEARLAYAVGSLFVAYLANAHDLEANLPKLFAEIRAGKSFRGAVRMTFGRTLDQLEASWRIEMERRTTWIATLSNGELIWGMTSVLFLLASVVAYRRKRRGIIEMPNEQPETEEEWPPTGMAS